MGETDKVWRTFCGSMLDSFRQDDLSICDDRSLLVLFTGADARTAPAAKRRVLDAANRSGPTWLQQHVSTGDFQLGSDAIPFTGLSQIPGPGSWGSAIAGSGAALKRAVDIVGAGLGCLLVSPLMALCAIGIRLTSEGPILFQQRRIGTDGNEFRMLKFRTMRHGSDEAVHRKHMKRYIKGESVTEDPDGCAKISDDDRVVPFGAFLRRWSLDELPQFLNVLAGTMSLVGPRPSVHYELEFYQDWHRERLVVKPGITGLWQVYGRGGTTFDEMTRTDIRYVRNWSLWQDLKLIVLTVPAVLGRMGAR